MDVRRGLVDGGYGAEADVQEKNAMTWLLEQF